MCDTGAQKIGQKMRPAMVDIDGTWRHKVQGGVGVAERMDCSVALFASEAAATDSISCNNRFHVIDNLAVHNFPRRSHPLCCPGSGGSS